MLPIDDRKEHNEFHESPEECNLIDVSKHGTHFEKEKRNKYSVPS